MPNIIISSGIKDLHLHLWEISEPLNWFLDEVLLTSDEDLEFGSMLGKRQLEFVVQRFLLNKYLEGPKPLLKKTTNGKPFLANRDEKISISHSKNMLVVSSAPLDHGVDLEWVDERIIRLVSKFCNEEEMLVPSFADPVLWYTLIWSCKEALYKVDGLGQLEFKTQISTLFKENSFNEGWGRGSIERNGVFSHYLLYYVLIKGFVLSWAYPCDHSKL